MTRFALRTVVVSAFVVGVSLAIFFGFLNHNRNSLACHGCQLPRPVLVAKVSIAKGTSGRVIDTGGLLSAKEVGASQVVKGAFLDPAEFRGEITIRAIPPGARLTAADFALRGPLYYPRGYPKSVSASETPAKMSRYLPAQSFPSDLEVAPASGWTDRRRKPRWTSTLQTEPWSVTAAPCEPSKPTIRRSRSQQSAGEPRASLPIRRLGLRGGACSGVRSHRVGGVERGSDGSRRPPSAVRPRV